jgi:ubiquinone/menaquinone biosynthesis C-methylase UbiE
MLERILEPEVMDTEAEAADYDAMDHTAVNRLFVADFLAVWNRSGPILDLGTGTAQIPIEFCRQSPRGQIIAVDLAVAMIARAKQNVERAGLTHRIEPVLANARGFDRPASSFSAIISNSIVHHIPEPRTIFAEIARLAAPGATLFIRDLMRPASRAELDALVVTYAAGANDHQRRMFAESLHAALTVAEVRERVAESGYDPQTVTATSDRHWTWAVPGQTAQHPTS